MLEVGSNSAQLQLVDGIAGPPPLPVHAVKEAIHLGEEMGGNGSISQTAIDRVTSAVDQAVSVARGGESSA